MKEMEGKEGLNLQNIVPGFVHPSICQEHGFDWVSEIPWELYKFGFQK